MKVRTCFFTSLCAVGIWSGSSALFPRPTSADVLVLKNGNEIRGQVLSQGPDGYRVLVPYGQITIPTRQVREVVPERESDYLVRTGERLLALNNLEAGLDYLRRAFDADRESPGGRKALVNGLLTAASDALRQRHLRVAAEHLKECRLLAPDDSELTALSEELQTIDTRRRTLLASADAAYQEQDFLAAFRHYRHYLQEFREDREAWRQRYAILAVLRGHALVKEKAYGSARELYREALENDPDVIAQLRTPLAFVEVQCVIPLLEEGNFEEGERRLAEAHDLLPDDAAIQYHLALCHEGQGNLSEAARVYSRLAGPDRNAIDGHKHLLALRRLAEETIFSDRTPNPDGRDHRSHRSAPEPGIRTSRSFVIHYQDPDRAREVERYLEHHVSQLKKRWFPAGSAPDWKRRIDVHLYPTKEEFLSAASPPPWSDGVARTDRRYGNIFGQELHLNAQSPQFLSAVVPHEVAHLLVPYRLGPALEIPAWIDEGLATAEEPTYKQRYYERIVREAAESGALLHLPDLLASRGYPPEPQVRVFYAQSNSIVRFLKARLGRRRTFTFFSQLLTASIEGALGGTRFDSVPELDRAWKQWALGQR